MEENIYFEDDVLTLEEDDTMNSIDAAFMKGYIEASAWVIRLFFRSWINKTLFPILFVLLKVSWKCPQTNKISLTFLNLEIKF